MTFEYICHFIFIFAIYYIIYRYKRILDYCFFVKLGMWEKTEEFIYKIRHAQLIAKVTKIK